MREDRDWMDTLIGHSVVDARHRKVLRVATSRFLEKALKLRAKYLGQDSSRIRKSRCRRSFGMAFDVSRCSVLSTALG